MRRGSNNEDIINHAEAHEEAFTNDTISTISNEALYLSNLAEKVFSSTTAQTFEGGDNNEGNVVRVVGGTICFS